MAICFVSAVRTTLVPVTGGGCAVVTGGGCNDDTGGGCTVVVTGGGRTVLAALLSLVVAAYQITSTSRSFKIRTPGAGTGLCTHHGHLFRVSGTYHTVVTGGGRISDYVNKSILQDKDTRRRHWTLYPPWPSVSCQRYGPHWSLSRVVAALLSRVVAALLSRVVAALLSRVVAHCCHGWSPHCFGCAVVTGGGCTVVTGGGALLSRVVAALFWLRCCHWWSPHCFGALLSRVVAAL